MKVAFGYLMLNTNISVYSTFPGRKKSNIHVFIKLDIISNIMDVVTYSLGEKAWSKKKNIR